MDAGFLDSSPEAQMELMNMMLHMERLSDQLLEHHPHHHQLQQPPPLPAAEDAAAFPSTAGPSISAPVHPFGLVGSTSLENLTPLAADHAQASVAAMREMIFHVAAMQPVYIDPESVKPPKRRNVRTSKNPQSVAARHRRRRISERIRILQRLVPGGTKMDTASMLDEAIHYVKFLKSQVQSLQRAVANSRGNDVGVLGFSSSGSNACFGSQVQGHINHTYTN